MLFTSYRFLGFLAALLLLYYILPKRFQWILLLAGSYVFYFAAGPSFLLYILAATVTTWFAARRIGDNLTRQRAYLKEHAEQMDRGAKKAYKKGEERIRRRWLAACLLLNLGVLAVVKYTNFVISNINGVLSLFGGTGLSPVSLVLPLGISFYTFQAVGYLIDVYRGTVPAERNLPRFALFISFFPQLIQGPISRWGDLSRTLYQEHEFDGRQVAFGLQRMLWGYFKKMVVADRVLAAVMTIVGGPEVYRGAYILAGMVFYTLQLYPHNTAGIDITNGVAEALGIQVQENFIRPYFSKSLKEYWRRWHVSMSSWFRDYLFYPVSTSRWMQRFTRFVKARLGEKPGRRLPVYLSTFVVWLATGVWHGASWNFIVWGLANWAVLMASEELEPLYGKFHQRYAVRRKLWYRLFQVGRLFLLVCILNLFDCYPSLSLTFGAFASIFTAGNWEILWDGSLLALGLSALDYGILACGTALMLLVSLSQRGGSVREKIARRPYAVRFAVWYGLFLIVLLMGIYGVGYDASQFIYNQF